MTRVLARLRQWSIMASCSCHPRCERGGHRLVIAERQDLVADDLAGLVPLAGDQERITGLQRRDPCPDRLSATADACCALRRRQNGGADRFWILAARIVVGYDDMIGILGRN